MASEATTLDPSEAAHRRVHRRKVLIENLQGWLFASPWIIGLVALFLGPMVWSIYLSLSVYNAAGAPALVGLGNYIEMLNDPLIFHSLKVTTIYAVLSVPLNLFLGLSIAILLNQKIRGLAAWRTIYYLPSVVSGRGGGAAVGVAVQRPLRTDQLRPATLCSGSTAPTGSPTRTPRSMRS